MPPAMFRARLEIERRRILQSRSREKEKQAYRERIEQAENDENLAIAKVLLARENSPDRVPLVALPSGCDRLVPLSGERRQRYRKNLRAMLADALACASVEELPRDQHYDAHDRRLETGRYLSQQTRLERFYDQLCGQCRGGCCAAGGDHAHLSAVGLRRVLDANPEMRADDLVQIYVDHLPQQSMAGACINQTADGCALPRELRSDICNGYFCPGLKALKAEWEMGAPERLLVIQRSNNNWNRFERGEANPVVAVIWVEEDRVVPAE